MKHAKRQLLFDRSSSGEGRARGARTLLFAGVLIALSCLSGSTMFAESFTYVHVIGTGDPTPDDPHRPRPWAKMDDTIAACDLGALTDFGLMANVCSFDGDANSNGGVYFEGGAPHRSFRREDPLPGQKVGFEKAVIPFGIPALHPTTGDTYLTAFFDRLPGEETGHSNRPGGRQKGVYVYGYKDNVMKVIADTTTWSAPLPENAMWTDFSTNVAVSASGAFFVGDYRNIGAGTAGQGIYQYADSELVEIVGDPASTQIPGTTTTFSRYRAVAANSSTVLFVGESGSCGKDAAQLCLKGVYAYDLGSKQLSTVMQSGMEVDDIGTFLDFAVEPEKGIFHSSIATNEGGDIVLVARYKKSDRALQGVFLLKRSGRYIPSLILSSGVLRTDLLKSRISSFNTVAINSRGEITFVVASNKKLQVPEQGLVFYRSADERLLSVFKQGDTFLADLQHAGEETTDHGGLVSGSQALDSSDPGPKIFFRHFYKAANGVGYSMLVLAQLNK